MVTHDGAVAHGGVGCRWQVGVQVVKGSSGGMREGGGSAVIHARTVHTMGQGAGGKGRWW